MTTLQLSLLPEDNSILLPQASLARIYLPQITVVEDWKVNGLDCSLKSSDCFAQFSPNSCSLKTYQTSLIEDLTEFCGKFPKAGTMQNGKLYQRPAWVRHTYGKDCLLLPTPAANPPGWKNRNPIDKSGNQPTHWNQRWYDKETGRLMQKGLEQVMNLLPTPKAMDSDRGSVGTITRFNNRTNRKSLKSAIGNLQPDVENIKGQLDPEFVTWLMGFPPGWTDLNQNPSASEPAIAQPD